MITVIVWVVAFVLFFVGFALFFAAPPVGCVVALMGPALLVFNRARGERKRQREMLDAIKKQAR